MHEYDVIMRRPHERWRDADAPRLALAARPRRPMTAALAGRVRRSLGLFLVRAGWRLASA